MRRSLRPQVASLTVLATLTLLPSCRDPTSVMLVILSDVACDDHPTTSISVARRLEETRSPRLITEVCQPDGTIGTLVVVPAADRDEDMSVRVVTSLRGDSCAQPDGNKQCIVSLRRVQFVAHEQLVVPVLQGLDCAGIACGATSTCRQGQCVDAQIDPGQCKDGSSPCEVDPGPAAGSGGGSGSGGAGGSGGGVSCEERYGSAPGFQLCTQTETGCTFNATRKKPQSCRQLCEAHDGTCLDAQDNAGNIACKVSSKNTLTCDSTSSLDSICVCSR